MSGLRRLLRDFQQGRPGPLIQVGRNQPGLQKKVNPARPGGMPSLEAGCGMFCVVPSLVWCQHWWQPLFPESSPMASVLSQNGTDNMSAGHGQPAMVFSCCPAPRQVLLSPVSHGTQNEVRERSWRLGGWNWNKVVLIPSEHVLHVGLNLVCLSLSYMVMRLTLFRPSP